MFRILYIVWGHFLSAFLPSNLFSCQFSLYGILRTFEKHRFYHTIFLLKTSIQSPLIKYIAKNLIGVFFLDLPCLLFQFYPSTVSFKHSLYFLITDDLLQTSKAHSFMPVYIVPADYDGCLFPDS